MTVGHFLVQSVGPASKMRTKRWGGVIKTDPTKHFVYTPHPQGLWSPFRISAVWRLSVRACHTVGTKLDSVLLGNLLWDFHRTAEGLTQEF